MGWIKFENTVTTCVRTDVLWDDQCTSNSSRLIIITGKAPTYKERMEVIKKRILLFETQSS